MAWKQSNLKAKQKRFKYHLDFYKRNSIRVLTGESLEGGLYEDMFKIFLFSRGFYNEAAFHSQVERCQQKIISSDIQVSLLVRKSK